jgi:hypothetical protein
MISQTSSIVQFFVATFNMIFNLKRFFSRLEAIIFERNEIERKIFMNQVRIDSQFKKIILASFNENEVIMRRIVEYDDHENKISIKDSKYKIYKKTSLKTRNIIYRRE